MMLWRVLNFANGWFFVRNPAWFFVRNPANQLSLGKYPIIYKVLASSQVVVWDFWTINSITIGYP